MRRAHAVTAAFCTLLAASALADANLVANPGFETGDFTGWTLLGNDTRSDHSFVSGPTSYPAWNEWLPRGGDHFAALGAVRGLLILRQTFATNPGESYLVSFQLGSDGERANYFFAEWNDSYLVSLENQPETPGHDLIHGPPAAAYRAYNFAALATGSTTTIQFVANNDQGWWALDDISVMPLPEPSSLLSAAAGILAVTACARRRASSPGAPRCPANASARSSRRSTPTTRARQSRSTATSR